MNLQPDRVGPTGWRGPHSRFRTQIQHKSCAGLLPKQQMLTGGNGDDDGGAETAWLSLKAAGDAFHKSQDYGAAVGAYTAALQAAEVFESKHAVLYSNRAASHLELKRPLLALDDAENAIKLSELQNVCLECWPSDPVLKDLGVDHQVTTLFCDILTRWWILVL